MKNYRDFTLRPLAEQQYILNETWCDHCGEADLGMTSPTEHEEDGRIYVEGSCVRCGKLVRTQITITTAGHD